MSVVKFHLSGDTACFRKPDVNTYVYFTYGQIHKVALLGLFGAILGYEGYRCSKGKQIEIPEFYKKLCHLKVGMVPCAENGVFSKKIQIFNNTVGYACQEAGGTLNVKEQWLEHPAWDIYVKVEEEQGQAIAKALLEKRCVYMPYLGKNDHFASITEVEWLEEEKVVEMPTCIDSFFLKKDGILHMELEEDYDDGEDEEEEILYFKYEEMLPVGIEPESCQYIKEKMLYSNMRVEAFSGEAMEIGNKIIAFY